MAITLDPIEDTIIATVGDFINSILTVGHANIIVGQDNLVPEPTQPDFVIMTPILRKRLAYGSDFWAFEADPTLIDRVVPTEVTLQIDVHGPASSDNAEIIAALWQNEYGFDFFNDAAVPMRPLYIDEPAQIPFLNEENQYETRWVLKAALQAVFTVSTPQDFADTLEVGFVNVEAAYPAES